MSTPIPPASLVHAEREQVVRLVVVAGVVALAVAMGIGRFAFTPLMPLMIRDGTLGVAAGAEWAAANYAGYLVGALTAARFAADPRRGLLLALAGVALATLGGALAGGAAAPLATAGATVANAVDSTVPGIAGSVGFGALLRGAAGVFSAWTLVCVSGWGLGELARRQAPHQGAWIYTGVGLGITVAGVLAWLGGAQPARWLWLEMGLLAVAGAILAGMNALRVPPAGATPAPGPSASSAPTAPTASPSPSPSRQADASQFPLVLCYGTFGFGYIVPATFLPAMARQQVADPLVFGLAWPLFGIAAALSVVGAARWLSGWPRRRVWALAQGAMAIGTALPLVTQAMGALAVSAVFVGGTFMVATMAGLQLARERVPANPTPLLARMTVAFAAGQILGPLLVRALGATAWAGWDALALANALATVLLVASAAWLWRGGRTPAG